MRKSKIGFLLLIALVSLLFVPNIANAFEVVEFDEHEDGLVLLASETKYYKTTIYYDNGNSVMNFGPPSAPTSETVEVTYEEYMNANPENSVVINASHTIETLYRYVTSYLYQNGSKYRYKSLISWKTMPSVRSHDIIAIGFYSSVTPSNAAFQQQYCSYSHGCGTTSLFYPSQFSEGASAVFPLVTYDDLYSLTSIFYIDVEKTNPNNTLTYQLSSADYSHATTSVSAITAKSNHSVIQDVAIVLGSSISSYYDTSNESSVLWNGTW